MSFNANCGERLREERDRLGFTQQEMADQMGVRREMSSRYERGQAVPGGDALAALALAGGDIQYVLTGQRSNSAMTPEEIELLSGFRKLDLRGKVNMLGMLDVVGTTSTEISKPTATPRSGSQFLGKVKAKHVTQGDQHIAGDQNIEVGGKSGKKTKKKLGE
ncbi:helix-turn-helix domain-containing protein [Collimonas arenae]|nr:helix-turn-helix transcriptional regulator [Collimonas arenae]